MHQRDKDSPSSGPWLDRRSFLRLSGGAVALAGASPLLGRLAKATSSGALERFDPPAKIRDLAGSPALQAALDEAWNINANGWTEQAILGNPWTVKNASHQVYYYNPLKTDLRGGLQTMVTWPAFPNRIAFYYPELKDEEQWQMADNGTVGQRVMPNIPQSAECDTFAGVPITPDTPTIPYPPYGPRGWLDEYCEMAHKTEEVDGKTRIVAIHFTCENPEYWYTLWSVDPESVARLYRETLGNDAIKVEDLQLTRDGKPVIDPSTGRAAYNPLNPWNSGTSMTASSGGAMHLTSTPNTIQTELQLAGGATVQRTQGNINGSQLICCGQYGQIYRNSDPHIGQLDNQVVGLGYRVSLANPIGLYIQMPEFDTWSLPDDPRLPPDAHPSECWRIVRGVQNLDGFPSNMNFILHAAVEIPKRWRDAGATCTVSDIKINGNPIRYGSQVMQNFNVALFPLGVKADKAATPEECVGDSETQLAYPQQIMFAELWDAYYGSNYSVPYRVDSNGKPVQMNLASNTVIVAPRVKRGQTVSLALAGSAFTQQGETLPTVEFIIPGQQAADPDIEVSVLSLEEIAYAVPGNSVPGSQTLLRLSVKIGENAALEGRDLRVTNPGQQPAEAGRWFLWVLPA